MAGLSSPRPLRKDDDRHAFDCGEKVLNHWLRRHAWGNEVTNASRTYVVTDKENGLIAGFVSLATGQIERALLSKPQQRNQPERIPVLVLGQLAIDIRYQGRRLGVSLLKHAFEVAVAASQKVGVVGVVTHPLNTGVRSYYQKWGFESLPGDTDGALFLRIKDLVESGFGMALGRWADTAQGRFRATGQGHYRDDAIAAYGRFLENNPGHVGASVALYSMLGSRYITHAGSQDMQRVRELFAATSLIKTSPGLAPPSLIEALIFVKRGARIDAVAAQMRDLLRAAIRENPNNPTSHLLLADTYYGTDRPALAEAMIEQAYQAAPENPRVLNARAVMYYERAESSMCALDRDAHRSDLSQAVDALKAAAKANPKKAELARHLSNMYEAMGRPQLALFQARRFDELADNADSRWYLLDQFTAARQFEDAKRQGEINIERDGRDAFVLGQLAMVAYQQGDRESALTLFREYRLLARRPSVYNLVREANLAESAGRQAQASKALAAADVESGSFEAALLSYHRKSLDKAGLLAAADDACEASEAHYFIARRALREGDKPLAREHFHKTLALRVPRYFEHVSATMRLDEM